MRAKSKGTFDSLHKAMTHQLSREGKPARIAYTNWLIKTATDLHIGTYHCALLDSICMYFIKFKDSENAVAQQVSTQSPLGIPKKSVSQSCRCNYLASGTKSRFYFKQIGDLWELPCKILSAVIITEAEEGGLGSATSNPKACKWTEGIRVCTSNYVSLND